MTRSKLKGIVKECLVEILSEGMGDPGVTQLRENTTSRRERKKASIGSENRRLEEHRRHLDSNIENTVTSLTSNSVMQDILADTARTTLQEQLSHEGGSGPSGPGINIDNIFSESSQVWTELAFSDKKIT